MYFFNCLFNNCVSFYNTFILGSIFYPYIQMSGWFFFVVKVWSVQQAERQRTSVHLTIVA